MSATLLSPAASCKGSYLLGTACGRCEKCVEERHLNSIVDGWTGRWPPEHNTRHRLIANGTEFTATWFSGEWHCGIWGGWSGYTVREAGVRYLGADETERLETRPEMRMETRPVIGAEIARRLRAAADAFNAAVDEAHKAGIAVNFSTALWPGSPCKAQIGNLSIERPAKWHVGYPGERL